MSQNKLVIHKTIHIYYGLDVYIWNHQKGQFGILQNN